MMVFLFANSAGRRDSPVPLDLYPGPTKTADEARREVQRCLTL
jgi:hypothetical protein